MCEHKEISIRITGKGEMHTFAKCRSCNATIEIVDCADDSMGKAQREATEYLYKLFLPNK